MTKLHADSIVKSYDGRPILTDIYLSCEVGEIVGLLGRNGCGKSTMLKIIFGSLRADYRYVSIDSCRIKGLTDGYRHINYLPQEGFLPSKIKVRSAINLFCSDHNAEFIENDPTIKPLLNRRSYMLSGGEKRYLEVLMMIFSDARFVLIDEPFNGLSPIYIDRLKNLIKSRTENKGFIITDHNYRNVIDLSSRLILMHDRGLRNIKDPEELRRWGYIP